MRIINVHFQSLTKIYQQLTKIENFQQNSDKVMKFLPRTDMRLSYILIYAPFVVCQVVTIHYKRQCRARDVGFKRSYIALQRKTIKLLQNSWERPQRNILVQILRNRLVLIAFIGNSQTSKFHPNIPPRKRKLSLSPGPLKPFLMSKFCLSVMLKSWVWRFQHQIPRQKRNTSTGATLQTFRACNIIAINM